MSKTMLKREHLFMFTIIGLTLLIKLLSIGFNDLLVEEAYYWNYAIHLDLGYLDHPPMVAFIIKLFTSLFGTNEFGVRIAAVICWMIATLFSFKLANLIKQGAGLYAALLMAILPFFFIHSLVITPDIPLIVCWSAALFYLYRAQVLNHATAWYAAGLWLGLGMLSKYSIVLLGPATLIYLIMTPQSRTWFLRKEPYICLLITLILFTPVIYWNASHNWASFAFQSTRRLHANDSFSFHQLLGLFVVFLKPLGILGFIDLFRKKTPLRTITVNTKRFIQVYTLVPLAVFSIFSLTHEIKFNWIGPCLLAIVPWLAVLMSKANSSLRRNWLITAVILIFFYAAMIICIITGRPVGINQTVFNKFIAWGDLVRQVHSVALHVETSRLETPIIVPLDKYNIGSELNFYQAKFQALGQTNTSYKIIGGDLFGQESLMYRYWSQGESVKGKLLILISEQAADFNNPAVTHRVIAKSDVKELWSHSQGLGTDIRKYYYQVVQARV